MLMQHMLYIVPLRGVCMGNGTDFITVFALRFCINVFIYSRCFVLSVYPIVILFKFIFKLLYHKYLSGVILFNCMLYPVDDLPPVPVWYSRLNAWLGNQLHIRCKPLFRHLVGLINYQYLRGNCCRSKCICTSMYIPQSLIVGSYGNWKSGSIKHPIPLTCITHDCVFMQNSILFPQPQISV